MPPPVITLPKSAYGPSLPSPSVFLTPSDALTSFRRSSGSARRPFGVVTIQPGGRSDGLVPCANAALPGAVIIATTDSARDRSRMFITGVTPLNRIGKGGTTRFVRHTWRRRSAECVLADRVCVRAQDQTFLTG